MPPRRPPADNPTAFLAAVETLRTAGVRAEVRLHEVSAGPRLAPQSYAVVGDVVGATPDDEDLATGRLVILHDPEGQEAWDGTTRCVAYVHADVEREMAADPLLGGVGWSWLLEALDRHGASYGNPGGTVTSSNSEGFGQMRGETDGGEVEIKASWTVIGNDLTGHLRAWCDLLCFAAGLPPVAPGIAVLPRPSKARPAVIPPAR
ncbi:MAG: hypothetical protein QOC60_1194 [Frankiaceae bacterium]|jgi:hypothetical protein|nr:hypothetical protein [Frankiaceae bacterium]MDQ1715249.1 hypothetical protein [Frankiaceae bacterium]